jgi:hypothetical protein
MKTPEEVFIVTKPNVSNLCIFGINFFVHIPRHKRAKMDAKAVQCILRGIDDLTKGYRCFRPTTKRIIISRDITVVESSLRDYHIGEETNATFPFQLFQLYI